MQKEDLSEQIFKVFKEIDKVNAIISGINEKMIEVNAILEQQPEEQGEDQPEDVKIFFDDVARRVYIENDTCEISLTYRQMSNIWHHYQTDEKGDPLNPIKV